MKRFRWSRKTYRHAASMARLCAALMELPEQMPSIVRRYFDLWDRHRFPEDPLSTPLWLRLERHKGDSDIPF